MRTLHSCSNTRIQETPVQPWDASIVFLAPLVEANLHVQPWEGSVGNYVWEAVLRTTSNKSPVCPNARSKFRFLSRGNRRNESNRSEAIFLPFRAGNPHSCCLNVVDSWTFAMTPQTRSTLHACMHSLCDVVSIIVSTWHKENEKCDKLQVCYEPVNANSGQLSSP